MYFRICSDNGKNVIGEIKSDKNISTQDLLKQYNLEGKVIWIKTEHCAFPLKDNDHPFIDHPELILNSRPGVWDNPITTLFIFSEIDKNSIILFMTPKHNTENNIPRLTIIVPQSEFNSKLSRIYEFISNSFLKSVEVESISINDQKLDDNTTIKHIFDKAKAGSEITVYLNISEKCNSEMKNRTKAINDFISTESRFVNDLTALDQDWKENIKHHGFFSESDFNILFQDITMILNFHKQLLSLLQSKNNGYATDFSRVFLEQAPFFRVSSNYISSFSKINNILKGMKYNSDFQNFCHQFSEKFGGLDFSSFLITPIQRIARYHLLLKDLQSRTPPNHPDFFFIKSSYNVMKNISEEMNKKTGFVESQQILLEIQMRNSSDFEFVKPDRIVLKQFDTIIKSRNLEGSFIVCNDYIILIDTLDIYCRFKSPSDAVPIEVLDDGLTVKIVSLDYDDKYENGNEVSFLTKDDRSEFLNLIKIEIPDSQ